MRVYIIVCMILILVLSQEDQHSLTAEERNLIKCCFQNLDCCNQKPTTFEVRALLVKCFKSRGEEKKNIVTRRIIRSVEQDYANITKCSVTNCRRKLRATVKIKNSGLTNCKNQYILIKHIYDSITGQKQKLFNPYVLKFYQQPVMEVYELYYESMVNAEAKETVYNKNTTDYAGCNSADTSTNLACGTIRYESDAIPYSRGFCCHCNKYKNDINFPVTSYEFSKNKKINHTTDNLRFNLQKRGGQDCNDESTPPDVNPETYHASSHCLKFSDLWYSVYCIKKPKIQHLVSLQIFQKYQTLEPVSKWNDLTKKLPIVIGTDSQLYINDEQSLSVHYILVDTNSINFGLNYKVHKILIPDTSNIDSGTHPEVQGGPDEYLVIKANQVQPNGKTCNVAGVGYEAFVKQPNRCGMPRDSCLKNQPINMWKEDNRKQAKGKKGTFFLKSFGVLPENPIISTGIENKTLSFLFTKYYSSTIEIEIKDDDNTILRANSLAIITEVFVDSTDSQKTTIVAKVFNSGLISSIFYVALTDCPLTLPASFSHITSMPVLIPPQYQHVFKLDIQCPLNKQSFFCNLHVHNLKKELIAIRNIRLKQSARCICMWYCSCTCYPTDYHMHCEILSLLSYHAAGFQGSMPVPLQVVEYSPIDYLVSMTTYILLTLCLTLLIMGIIKALIGLCVISISLWGFDVVLDLPKENVKYYEDNNSSIHERTGVRMKHVEFCTNLVFFFIYPFCLIWTVVKKSYFSTHDHTKTDICYCKEGIAVKRKSSGLQNSLTKKNQRVHEEI